MAKVLEAMASPQDGENDESGQWRRQFGKRITELNANQARMEATMEAKMTSVGANQARMEVNQARMEASQAQLAARMEAKLDLLLSQMVQTASDVRLVHSSGGE